MTQQELILLNPFKITSSDTDMYGRVRLGSLVNLLIQSAINSADSLGFGFANLREKKLFWVLSRMTVEIYNPIKWYDEVVVETWPKDLDKILYLRDYHIKDKKGNILVNATSGWLAIDLENKRPKVIDGAHARFFEELKDKHALNEIPEKVLPVKEGQPFENKACYFDIDLNKHVTATRYIDWMMDTFSLDFHKQNYPKKLTVNYLKETMPDETIRIVKSETNNAFNFEGINLCSQTPAFRGKIAF